MAAAFSFVLLAATRQKAKKAEHHTGSATDQLKAASDEPLQRLVKASETLSALGPEAGIQQTRAAIVAAARDALGSDLVALFTIDPCTASIDSESASGITEEIKTAILGLYDVFLTDRQSHRALRIENVAEKAAEDAQAHAMLVQSGIKAMMACPVRSDASASGVLAALFRDRATIDDSEAEVLEGLCHQASAVISYALAMEQSRELVDGLAGANMELSFQATSDGLTGLANHRTFQQTISDICKKAARSTSRVFSLVMVDVDHFKIYNDTHGHREGDAVLQAVAKTLASGLRQGDLAARYGGEEFTIIFRDTNKEAAYAAADRIRRAVAEQNFRKGSVTVSMGVAEFPTDGRVPSELIEHADKALYHAKIMGRNRVFVWGSSKSVSCECEEEAAPVESAQKCVLLIEDPHEPSVGAVRAMLDSLSYRVEAAAGATEALELLKTRVFDIALVSLDALPEKDVKSLGQLAAIHPDMPIVLMAPNLRPSDSREALRRGASDVLVLPCKQSELPVVIERNLERRRLELQRMIQKSTGILLQAIDALVASIDAKDHFTAGHSDRVTLLSLAIAERLNLSNEERYALELAAKLHDIGKIGLPDSSLNKESPLTEEEWEAMREHPSMGSKIVGAIDELAYVSTIIRHHHERLDGTGYPDGLRGPTIPLLSRIIAVADAYEAMTSERAHRSRLSPTEAMEELERRAGIFYGPRSIAELKAHLIAEGELPADYNCDQKASAA